MDAFASPKYQKSDDLEVTGVSRSGRIRKKPSKLTDFGSCDDAADKPKKQNPQQFEFSGPYDSPGPSGRRTADHVKKCTSASTGAAPSAESSSTESRSSDSASEEDHDTDGGASDDTRQAGFTKLEVSQHEIPSQANSLYMLEKNRKKIVMKGGRVIGGPKTQRRDKGKARFTAYMLWAKDIRQRLAEQRPDMDFAALSKRLGELWSTVPHLEKRNWRRRAKRLVFNPSSRHELKNDPARPPAAPVTGRNFINTINTAKQERASPMTKKTRRRHVPRSSMKDYPTSTSSSHSADRTTRIIASREKLRVVGTQPIDVASHLTLLGESLTVIGELLANHKGEIAVSGGLSVLLDSLLCAMGPLICLTQQVSEINGADQATLSKILDNLAYVMPGL